MLNTKCLDDDDDDDDDEGWSTFAMMHTTGSFGRLFRLGASMISIYNPVLRLYDRLVVG